MMVSPEIPVRLTEHARQRAAEMSLRTKQVKLTLREPEVVYIGRTPGCEVALRDNLAVPFRVERGVRIGITVLWRGQEER
jgi:hypothetical protein